MCLYLCYDIKGIQRFIFSVPKLKCVIGASGLIADFDRKTVEEKANACGVKRVFSGGGRGAFYCPNETAADALAGQLIAAAHDVGLDIRIGKSASLSEAAHRADRLYPCCPPALDPDDPLRGEPCAMSGLWPVPENVAGEGRDGVHPLIRMRAQMARRDHLGKRILEELRANNRIPEEIAALDLTFFKNVTPDRDDDMDEAEEAKAGYRALGRRNRWAIVAMDGNDMGRQFLAFEELRVRAGWSESKTQEWLKCMSTKLDECTRLAFLEALGNAIAAWVRQRLSDGEGLETCLARKREVSQLVLPFRPLILGGDDVTLLCHSSYAMSFVQDMARSFREHSKRVAIAAKEAGIDTLWPATGGELSISAGILYAKVSFPLHMAIPYAESLLASAKGRFRASPKSTCPTPAAVDWDTITDTLVDTPAARRNRELRFMDDELGREIQITRRPYLLGKGNLDQSGLDNLLDLKKKLSHISPSVRARILPSLRRPWSERVAFVASVAKRHRVLMEELWEGGEELGRSWTEDGKSKSRVTGLPDALLLLEEEQRMARPTADE